MSKPGESAGPSWAATVPGLEWADRGVLFRARADRFRALAVAGSPLAGYFAVMAKLGDAQQALAQSPLGAEWAALARFRLEEGTSGGSPPLPFNSPPPADAWRKGIAFLCSSLSQTGSFAFGTIERATHARNDELDRWASRVLSGDYSDLDRSLALLVAATLQVYWAAALDALDRTALSPPDDLSTCPACGSFPLGSIITATGATPGLRHLCCSLCSSRWNLPRIRCVNCGSSKEVSYFGIEGGIGDAKAEACENCQTYSKVFYLEKNPLLDPFADDIATLSLDILMADAGYARNAVNPLLLPGYTGREGVISDGST